MGLIGRIVQSDQSEELFVKRESKESENRKNRMSKLIFAFLRFSHNRTLLEKREKARMKARENLSVQVAIGWFNFYFSLVDVAWALIAKPCLWFSPRPWCSAVKTFAKGLI